MCCINDAKVQLFSEPTKHFANFFIKIFKNSENLHQNLEQGSPRAWKRQTKSGQGIPTTEGCQLNLGQRILTTGILPAKSRATNSDHGKSTTYFWSKEFRPREIDYLFLGQRIPSTEGNLFSYYLFTPDIFFFIFH